VAFGLEDTLQARGERRVVFYDQESHDWFKAGVA